MSVIEVHQQDGVALVTLNRPEAHNALNRALSEAITTTFAELAMADSVRAIVLTGAGRAFCAGVDLKALTDEPELLSSGLGLGPESSDRRRVRAMPAAHYRCGQRCSP